MNVNPFSKKTAATTTPKSVKGASPLNEIGDVSAVTEMFNWLRQQNAQYDQAIAALVAANRIKNGWDKPAEPEMSLTIQREVLVGLGDAEALAKFDQEHQQELAQEQEARVKAAQQVLEAPTRVKALEQYINDLAAQMVDGLDESLIDDEIRRIFSPSAQRMLEAAKTFVQAWREMQSVESVLLRRVNLFHYSVTGDHRTRYEHELIGRRRDGELLPTLIEGLAFEELRDLNDQFTHHDSEFATALDNALRSVGFDAWGLKVYHPKGKNDERRIYAPDPNPPKKHLDSYNEMAAVVRVDVA
jgi:SOS response regulatory protein OraA/RecX